MGLAKDTFDHIQSFGELIFGENDHKWFRHMNVEMEYFEKDGFFGGYHGHIRFMIHGAARIFTVIWYHHESSECMQSRQSLLDALIEWCKSEYSLSEIYLDYKWEKGKPNREC